MKKKIFIIIAIWILISSIFAIAYTIKTQPKSKHKPIRYEGKMAKEPFKSIGIKMAEIALENKNVQLTPFIKELKEAGAEDIRMVIEINKSPVEKTLPPVVIGKKVFKNSTECGVIKYTYKGETYVVGTCK